MRHRAHREKQVFKGFLEGLCVLSGKKMDKAKPQFVTVQGISRTLGHHPRMLDVLHISDSAAVRRIGTWHGGCGILAGGIGGKVGDGKNKILITENMPSW